jgi:hypothetical protein
MRILSRTLRQINKTFAITVLTALAGLLVWTPALAKTASVQSITISPTSVKPVIKPGQSYSNKVKVFNGGSEPIEVKLTVAGYHVEGEAYDQSFTPLPGAPKVADWIHLSQKQTKIGGNSSLAIPYTVDVPANTPAGGYYAVVFAQTQTPKTSQGVIVNQRVGTIFYINVGGEVQAKGQLLSWKSRFLQSPPLSASLRLSNSSNVHYPAKIEVTVKDIFGRTKFTQSTVKEILPQTIRAIPINWPSTPMVGLVKVNGTVEFLGHSQALPTRYVLIASPIARLIAALIVLALLLWIGLPILRKKKKPYNIKR